ncbi:hypothetical protein P775_28225 [Puniceibacterium antarcticum]|uniref:Uncharacterized protein n=1 Tax=Puniceibacterium antarcticum TaxID=1206336 RepID=A0A2G8QSZ7_9RHOB|nr:hypothetical protein P775_28225 [Puniceibacterium antarcticum]
MRMFRGICFLNLCKHALLERGHDLLMRKRRVPFGRAVFKSLLARIRIRMLR